MLNLIIKRSGLKIKNKGDRIMKKVSLILAIFLLLSNSVFGIEKESLNFYSPDILEIVRESLGVIFCLFFISFIHYGERGKQKLTFFYVVLYFLIILFFFIMNTENIFSTLALFVCSAICGIFCVFWGLLTSNESKKNSLLFLLIIILGGFLFSLTSIQSLEEIILFMKTMFFIFILINLLAYLASRLCSRVKERLRQSQ